MAKKDIITYGHPMLSQMSLPVEKFDTALHTFIEDMFETMGAADGVGLAAVQVGVLKRLFILSIPEKNDSSDLKAMKRYVIINPEIVSESVRKQKGEEGCLSIPGIYAEVERPAKIIMKAQNENGEWYRLTARDLLARASMHELDHCNGVLFVQRVAASEREALEVPLMQIRTDYPDNIRKL